MTTLHPDHASFLLQYQLPALKNEQRTTAAVIAAIPPANSEYRPDPQARPAIEIAWHIVATEHRFLSAVIHGGFDFNAIPRPAEGLTPASVGKWYEENFAKDIEAVSRLNGEQLAKVLDFRGLFQLPAVSYLDFATRHTVHHRGQLSTYLRAMGGKVPAIYGESYDSAEAKKAAQAS